MIEPFVERGVRNIALKSAWWVVFSGWVTVLLLVGIGVWWFTSRDMLTGFTSGMWISTCSASMATMMLLFNVSCRYVEYRVGRAERMLENTQKINVQLNKLRREMSKGELLNSRDVLFALIDIAECIYFQEVDITIVAVQYSDFISVWLNKNVEQIKALSRLERIDIRILMQIVYQLEEAGEHEKKIFKV